MRSEMDAHGWRKDCCELAPDGETVHVWRVPEEAVETHGSDLAWTLSPEERAAAASFVRAHDQRAFTNRRAALRWLLGRYLGMPPAAVPLRQSRYGKLELGCMVGGEPLCFSISRTRGLVLYAFTRAGEIGIDVEWIDPGLDVERLVPWILSSTEWLPMAALPRRERLEAFYAAWTLQEACAKAVGVGLGSWLEETAGLMGRHHAKQKAYISGLTTQSLTVGSAFSAALAIRGDLPRVELLEWPWNNPGLPTR